MNNFNLTRFNALLKRQWEQYKKTYFPGVFILFGGLTLAYIVFLMLSYEMYTPPWDSDLLDYSRMKFREPILIVFGMAYLSLVSGQYYLKYKDASSGIQELTLPISKLENVLCALLLSVFLPLLTFLLVLGLCDGAFASYMQAAYAHVDFNALVNKFRFNWPKESFGFNYIWKATPLPILGTLTLIGLFISSACLLGSIYFKRYAYAKSILSLLVLGMLLIVKNEVLDKYLQRGQISVVDYSISNQYNGIAVFLWFAFILILFFSLIWAATYFRLKEKEV